MSKKGYIYKYTFPNGKVYIGQTAQNLEDRHYQHLYNAGHLDAKDRIILLVDRAIHKYGTPNLEIIEEIEFMDSDSVRFQEELNEKEKKYIREYKSTQKKYGYNRHVGGKKVSEKLILEDEWYRLFDEQNWGEHIANFQCVLYEYVKLKLFDSHQKLNKEERYVWYGYLFMDYSIGKESTFCGFYNRHKNDPMLYDIGDFEYNENDELVEPVGVEKDKYIFDKVMKLAIEENWIEDIRQTIWKQVMKDKDKIINEYNTESTILD